MILSNRPQPAPRSHISYPINPELAPCFSSPELIASATPPRGHSKHSFSKPMTWLNRSSSSTSNHTAPHAAPKPTRISEPKIGSSLDQLTLRRSGPLGSGATIVRTPQEALSGSARSGEKDEVKQDVLPHDTEKSESKLVQRSSSPPLPPLPDVPDLEEGDALSGSTACTSLSDHIPPPRSSGSLSHISSPRPTLVAHSRAPSRSTPSLPSDPNLSTPQPPFDAVLLSSIPDGAIDPSKLIVTLETCTTTYRILLRSLVSRPSYLSRYITSLLSPASETASIHSNVSDASSTQHRISFSAFFRDHLVSSGCLPRFASIHVFLDRPSAPYEHVLAYLRSVPSMPEHPETLPRAVQLGSVSHSSSSARLESLLELRDEACYLGLTELERLCCLEIQRFQRVAMPGFAGGTPRVQTPSVHSIHTVVEESPTRQGVPTRPSELRVSKSNSRRAAKSAARESSSGSSLENKDAPFSKERGRQVKGFKFEVGSPPPGWI